MNSSHIKGKRSLKNGGRPESEAPRQGHGENFQNYEIAHIKSIICSKQLKQGKKDTEVQTIIYLFLSSDCHVNSLGAKNVLCKIFEGKQIMAAKKKQQKSLCVNSPKIINQLGRLQKNHLNTMTACMLSLYWNGVSCPLSVILMLLKSNGATLEQFV